MSGSTGERHSKWNVYFLWHNSLNFNDLCVLAMPHGARTQSEPSSTTTLWGFWAQPTYSLKHVVSRYSQIPDHDYRNGKRQVVFVTNAQKLKVCLQYESPACVKCLGNHCDIMALWTPICIHSKNIKYKLNTLKSVARISANTTCTFTDCWRSVAIVVGENISWAWNCRHF